MCRRLLTICLLLFAGINAAGQSLRPDLEKVSKAVERYLETNKPNWHHLADTEPARLEDFPDEYCYFASEWKSNTGETIILLSKAH